MKTRIAVVGLVVVAAAGCSSSGGSDNTASTTPPVTSSPTPSVSPSQSASSSPTPTPSFSSTVQASRRCLTTQLHLSLGQGQGQAGSTITPIVLSNVSKHACTLFGYPGVSFLDASGATVGVDAAHTGGEEATVTLGPGDAANAQLQVPDPGNFSASDCQPAQASQLRVYPPNDRAALTVADDVTVCTTSTGRANVHPVTPGVG
ncbi:MAG: DUF4232 domain-containing protein [Mycobacteriales bacterium]